MTPRAADFSQWYADVVAAADLADASPVRGCAILKPNGYAIWEAIHARDGEAAMQAARAHIDFVRESMVETARAADRRESALRRLGAEV